MDLIEKRVVSIKEGMDMARRIGAREFIETSAKTGVGVKEMFTNINYF